MGNLHGKNGEQKLTMWSQDSLAAALEALSLSHFHTFAFKLSHQGSLAAALEAGYRGIDTASVYRFVSTILMIAFLHSVMHDSNFLDTEI